MLQKLVFILNWKIPAKHGIFQIPVLMVILISIMVDTVKGDALFSDQTAKHVHQPE